MSRIEGRALISAVALVWFFTSFLWTVNALRRPVPPSHRFPPLWLPGMLISELAPVFLVERALLAWLFVALGAADTGLGTASLVLFALSEVGLSIIISRTLRGARQTGRSPSTLTLFNVFERLPHGVEKLVEVPFWEDLTLDVYRRPEVAAAPCLIYVHPGSWMRGRPGRQARAMLHRLAASGWIVLDIRYPLSPAATFPEHLIGVKRAIAWAKTDGVRLGVDPGSVAVAGGSSGAHLAALAALTPHREDLQPGFESVDVSVTCCLAFYGIYDLLIRNPTRYDWPFIARHVMKAERHENPSLYALGSPIDQVTASAPPFLLVHGSFDSIVLPAESRHFEHALKAAGVDVTYHEVFGAQHGFDAIASLRTRAVAVLCVEWLETKRAAAPS